MSEAQEHSTDLGTTGVPYRSEAAEELIAERMRQLAASGRPAERMGVIRELAERGEIQTMVPGSVTKAALDEELLQSISPEKRAPQNAPSGGAGRTLAEGMAIAAAQRTTKRHSETAGGARGGRMVKLSEED